MTQSSRRRSLRRFLLIALGINIPILVALLAATQLNRNRAPTLIYDTLPAADSEFAYYTVLENWNRPYLTFSMMNCPSNIDCGKAHQTVREAAETWDSVSGLTLAEVTGSADIRIFWTVAEAGQGIHFDGPGGVLAYANLPSESLGESAGDVYFDDSENWVFDEPESLYEIHLYTIAVHELGHALGLGHSSNPASIMWQEYYGPETLYVDDIEGIQVLYGQPEVQIAEIPAPAAAENGNSADEIVPPAEGALAGRTDVNLNVRSGPGTDFRVVSVTEIGQQISVEGRNIDASWVYITYGAGESLVSGWAFTRYILVQDDLNTLPMIE